MKQIKSLLLVLMIVAFVNTIEAQTIRVLPVSSENISENAAEMLYNRLNQAVSLNGMA